MAPPKQEPAPQPKQRFYPRLFTAWAAFTILLLPLSFSQFVLPGIVHDYVELNKTHGIDMPLATQWGIQIGFSYSDGSRFGFLSWGALVSALVVIAVSMIYRATRTNRLAALFILIFQAISILWPLLIISGSYSLYWWNEQAFSTLNR